MTSPVHGQCSTEKIQLNGKPHTLCDDALAQDARDIKTTLQQLSKAIQSEVPGSQLAAAVTRTLHGFLKTADKKDPKTGRTTQDVLTGMPTRLDDSNKAALAHVFQTAYANNLPALDPGSETAKLVKKLGQQVFDNASKADQTGVNKALTDLLASYKTQLKAKNVLQEKTVFNTSDVEALSNVLSRQKGEVLTGHQPTNDLLAGLQKLASPDGKTVKPVSPKAVSLLVNSLGQQYTQGNLSQFAALDAKHKPAVEKALQVLLKNTPEFDAQKIGTLAKPLFGISSQP
jgi:hypothetical protein